MSSHVMELAGLRREAVDAAAAVLKDHWSSGALPVDPVAIARDMGVEVFSAQLGNEVIGVMLIDDQVAQIFLDEDLPPVRYRYAAAHALGHYVRHRDSPEDIGFVDSRTETEETDPEEVFANYFAAALLIPGWEVSPSGDPESRDIATAARFRVPVDALRYRRPPAA